MIETMLILMMTNLLARVPRGTDNTTTYHMDLMRAKTTSVECELQLSSEKRGHDRWKL